MKVVSPSIFRQHRAAVDFSDYANRLSTLLSGFDWSLVETLANDLLDAWKLQRQVFLCGNGGSAGNAIHIANDLVYAIAGGAGPGMRAHALPANAAVITCLANDEGYDQIFSLQLRGMADPGDLLICLSGSGNSANILAALDEARRIGMRSYALVGYSGGKAKELADRPIHLPIHDMQIAEDMQIIVGHMLMRFLESRSDEVLGTRS